MLEIPIGVAKYRKNSRETPGSSTLSPTNLRRPSRPNRPKSARASISNRTKSRNSVLGSSMKTPLRKSIFSPTPNRRKSKQYLSPQQESISHYPKSPKHTQSLNQTYSFGAAGVLRPKRSSSPTNTSKTLQKSVFRFRKSYDRHGEKFNSVRRKNSHIAGQGGESPLGMITELSFPVKFRRTGMNKMASQRHQPRIHLVQTGEPIESHPESSSASSANPSRRSSIGVAHDVNRTASFELSGDDGSLERGEDNSATGHSGEENGGDKNFQRKKFKRSGRSKLRKSFVIPRYFSSKHVSSFKHDKTQEDVHYDVMLRVPQSAKHIRSPRVMNASFKKTRDHFAANWNMSGKKMPVVNEKVANTSKTYRSSSTARSTTARSVRRRNMEALYLDNLNLICDGELHGDLSAEFSRTSNYVRKSLENLGRELDPKDPSFELIQKLKNYDPDVAKADYVHLLRDSERRRKVIEYKFKSVLKNR